MKKLAFLYANEYAAVFKCYNRLSIPGKLRDDKQELTFSAGLDVASKVKKWLFSILKSQSSKNAIFRIFVNLDEFFEKVGVFIYQ